MPDDMQDTFFVQDESDSRRYFGMTPHLINHLGLSAIAKAAFLFLLEDTGLHGGQSKCGTEKLAAGAEISQGSVTTAKQALRDAGLITWTKLATGSGPTHLIRIRDIWRLNTYVFAPDSDSTFAERLEKAKARLRADVQKSLAQSEVALENGDGNGDAPPTTEQLGMFPKRKPTPAAPRALSGTSLWRKAFELAVERKGWLVQMRDADATFKALGQLDPPPTEEEITLAAEELMQDIRPARGKAVWVYFNKLPTTIRARRSRADARGSEGVAATGVDVSGYLD